MAFTQAEMAKIQEARRLRRLERIARAGSLGMQGAEIFTGKQHLSELEKLEAMPKLIEAQQAAWEFDQEQAQDLVVRAFEENGRMLRAQIEAATQASIQSSRASDAAVGHKLKGLDLRTQELDRTILRTNTLLPQHADELEVTLNNIEAQRKAMTAEQRENKINAEIRNNRDEDGNLPRGMAQEIRDYWTSGEGGRLIQGDVQQNLERYVIPEQMRTLVQGASDEGQKALMADRVAASLGLTTEYVKNGLPEETWAAINAGRTLIDATNEQAEADYNQIQVEAEQAWTHVHGAAAGKPPDEFTIPLNLQDSVRQLEAEKAQALGYVPAQPSRGNERQELPKGDYFQQTSALDATYGGPDPEAARFDAAVGNMEAKDAERFLYSGHTPGAGSTAGYDQDLQLDGSAILETAAAMDPEGRDQIYSGEAGQFMGVPVPHMPSGPAQQLDYVLSTIEMFPEHGPAQEAKNAITGSHFFGEYMRRRGYTDPDLAWKEMNREFKLQKRAQRRDTRAARRQNMRDGSAPATASDLRQHGKRGLRQGMRSAGGASRFSPMSTGEPDYAGLPD